MMAEATGPTSGNKKSQKSLDYLGILKNAFGIVRHHRYLWYLGILAGTAGGSGFNSGGNFSSFSSQTKNNGTFDANQVWSEALKWIHANIVLIAAIASVLLVLCIIFTVLSSMAKAGLVHATGNLSENKESSFGEAMKFGWHKFWSVFGAGILIGLVVLGVFLMLAAPAVVFLFVNPLISIPLFLIILPVIFFVAVVTGIVYEYSLRYISLKDGKAVASIKSGISLLKKKKKETVLIWLMTLAISAVTGIVLVMAALLIGLILFLLGLVFFLLNPVAGIVYVAIAVAVFIVAFLVAGGFIGSFVSTYWTLCFKEIAE